MDKPLVSIIVPCYNQAQFLDDCLQSVFDQTYPDWECIIVNDGSPDNTEEIAKKWVAKDLRFKYLNKENGGLSSARNAGLKVANGDYIQLLDSDDLLQNEKLLNQVNAFLNDDEIDISVSGYRYFEDGFTMLKILGRENFLPEVALMKNDSDLVELFKIKNPMVISSPLYKKKVFEIVGFFDENLFSLEDWDFHTRCARNKLKFQHVGYQYNSLTLIRLHNQSMMRNKKLINNALLVYNAKQSIKIDNNKLKFWLIIKLFTPPILLLLVRKLKK